jgi:hypothetical protein
MSTKLSTVKGAALLLFSSPSDSVFAGFPS